MAQRSARETALAALRLWRKEKRFADSIISKLLANADLTSSDRAFTLDLFYGVLRNLTLLDLWIGCLRASHIGNNVRDILESAGASWEDLVDVTVFLTNMKADFPIYNQMWAQYFGNHPPCRTTVEINALPTPIAIELKCIAALKE